MNHLSPQHREENGGFEILFFGRGEAAAPADPVPADAAALTELAGGKIHFLQQVHGRDVLENPAEPAGVSLPPADALFFTLPDQAFPACIRIADCVPILFHAPEGNVYGGIHAGWKGLAADIIGHVLQRLSSPEKFRFWIGPCISEKSYEVGEDVFSRFPGQYLLPHPDAAKRYLDLRGAASGMLQLSGVPAANISHLRRDTLSDPLLYSHRGGDTGRNIAMIRPVQNSRRQHFSV